MPIQKQDFIKNCNKDSDAGHFLQDDIQYPEKGYNLSNYFPILLQIIKIENVEKLVSNLYDKKEYVIHIRRRSLAKIIHWYEYRAKKKFKKSLNNLSSS